MDLSVNVGEVLDHVEPHETAHFVRRNLSALDACEQLTNPERPATALLITHSGRQNERLLGGAHDRRRSHDAAGRALPMP